MQTHTKSLWTFIACLNSTPWGRFHQKILAKQEEHQSTALAKKVLCSILYTQCPPLNGIESADYCNKIWLAQLYINSTQNTSVNWIIRLLLSLMRRLKVILLSGGHCIWKQKIVTFKLQHMYVIFLICALCAKWHLPKQSWNIFEWKFIENVDEINPNNAKVPLQ